jgi:L-threonylcarbamoyladenylate synthase
MLYSNQKDKVLSIVQVLPVTNQSLKIASDILLDGGVVCIPTDTVYGLSAIATNEDAVKKIFRIKNRSNDTPLPIFINDTEILNNLTSQILTPEIMKLTSTFWPGPLTIVLKKSDLIPEVTVSGLNTAGFRIPNHRVPINLCKLTKSPLTATSANISGNLPATNAKMASDQFKNSRLDLILDDGETTLSVPSSIVDMSQPNERMIREGAISMEQIKSILHSG